MTKKIALTILFVLFTSFLFAEINQPGSGKIIKGMKKKPIHRGGIGSGCKWKMGGSDFYTDAGAAQMYEQTGGH